MLKKDLISEMESLKAQLEKEQSRPIGCHDISISDVNIDMGDSEEDLMIAEAVKEGMKALQSIKEQNKCGIYLK